MLAKMIDKILSLKQTQTFEINDQVYSDQPLNRIPPHVDRPEEIHVSGLDSICQLIRTELQKVDSTIMIHVANFKSVHVMTTYLDDFSRNHLYAAQADVPGFSGGWMDQEEALIKLRSLFIPGEGSDYLLDLLSRISDNSSVTSTDNGVTQTVEARQGIDLKTKLPIRPRVNLQPFRTFLEVPQPVSEFLLRLDKSGRIGFFEADGGVWKLEAKSNIVKYFERELKDLIETGKVVVMM